MIILLLFNFNRYLFISDWLLLYLALFIYICFYEGNFLLLHKSYVFFLFERPFEATEERFEEFFKYFIVIFVL